MSLAIFAAFAPTDRSLQLCADVREAMFRAGLSLKAVALTIQAPEARLSDQLHGKAPFTYLWRFTSLDDTFWDQLDLVRSERRGVLFIDSPDLVSLLTSIRTIGHFVKAHLSTQDERQVG